MDVFHYTQAAKKLLEASDEFARRAEPLGKAAHEQGLTKLARLFYSDVTLGLGNVEKLKKRLDAVGADGTISADEDEDSNY